MTTLFRPTGPKELSLVEASGFKKFPPRLPEQPFFYPVLNLKYAKQVAAWNVKSAGAGYILKFDIDDQYASKFERRVVGAREHEELWIPAEQLEEFNRHIIGTIQIVAKLE